MRALLAAMVLAAIVTAGCGGAESATLLPKGRALAVTRSFTPSLHLFGDPVVAHVELVVDRRLLDPGRVSLESEFEPYERVEAAQRMRRDYGPYTRLRYQYRLRCLTVECLPEVLASAAGAQESGRGERRTFTFPPARILYQDRGETRPSLLRTVLWPPLVSVSRIDEAQAGAAFPFRASPSPLPPLSQRISPPFFAALLLLAALGLVAWPASVLLRWWRTRQRPPAVAPAVSLSSLEQALRLVERSSLPARRGERREALERLAAELAEIDAREFETQTRALAWSRRSPSAEAAADLVMLVREEDGPSA